VQKKWRLRSPKLFKKVYQEGQHSFNNLLVIHYLSWGGETKIGLSVSKKVGNAVVRNKVKRRLRAILANVVENIKAGVLVVFVVRPPAATASFDQLNVSVINLLKKAKLLKEA